MSSRSRGKSVTAATAVSFSPAGAPRMISPVDGRQQQRRCRGRGAAGSLRANTAAGPPIATMRSGFGRSAKVDRMKSMTAS